MSALSPISPLGRWNGRLTSRPLPPNDPSLDELAPDERTLLANIWLSQCSTERRVARSFAVVHRALLALDADPGLVATAERAVDDEHRHAALCLEVASRYAGRALNAPTELPFAHPTHPSASNERVRLSLFVVGQCAFNETFASAYLDASLDAAQTPLARAAVRELLSDEIDHARIGWAFAATLPSGERREVEDWLLPLAVCNLREWRAIELPALSRERIAPHAIPERATVERALLATIESVMIPGFERFGLSTRALRDWHAAGAPTD